MSAATFLATLEVAANTVAAAETAYRREAAERIKTLERDRAFAFRRMNVMRPIAEAAGRAESAELAVAGGLAVLRVKLGWESDSEARSAILVRFTPIIQGVFLDQNPRPDGPPPDVLARLAEFEAWYQSEYRKSFWDLFDHPIPETPRVDF